MERCEIAVIGAGVVGAAIAYELVRRGADVALLDARGVGLGATQASAGMLVPYIEGFRHRAMMNLATASMAIYDEFIAAVSRDSGAHVGYRRSGSLEVASAEESVEELKTTASNLSAAGIRCAFLDGQAVRDAEPALAPDIVAGLLVSDHGFVDAGDLSGALSAAASRHGARIQVPARVRRIIPVANAVEIETENDRLVAGQVVLAAGSWSGLIEVASLPALPIRPIRGQLLHLVSAAAPLNRVTWGSRCYLVPGGDGSLLVGATVEDAGFDERATVAGVRDLLEAACDLVPHVWQATFAGARVGLRPATPDEMPIIGRSRSVPTVVFATGHYRNGVLLAPITARLVADLILENREDPLLAPLGPERFGDM